MLHRNCDSLTLCINKNSDISEFITVLDRVDVAQDLKKLTILAKFDDQTGLFVNTICAKCPNLCKLVVKINDKSSFQKPLLTKMVSSLQHISMVQVRRMTTLHNGMQICKDVYKYTHGSVSF